VKDKVSKLSLSTEMKADRTNRYGEDAAQGRSPGLLDAPGKTVVDDLFDAASLLTSKTVNTLENTASGI